MVILQIKQLHISVKNSEKHVILHLNRFKIRFNLKSDLNMFKGENSFLNVEAHLETLNKYNLLLHKWLHLERPNAEPFWLWTI